MNVKVFNMNAKEVGTMDLSAEVFACEYNEALIHQAVVAQLTNARQGTKCTLTRSEVRGGGAKPWRQKGTGRARQGSIRAPQWIKGGVVFAPKPRDFGKKMNAKSKKIALLSAISAKVAQGEFIVVDDVKTSGKTKEFASMVKAFNLPKNALYVGSYNENNLRASANLANFERTTPEQISVYEVVRASKILITKEACLKIQEVNA